MPVLRRRLAAGLTALLLAAGACTGSPGTTEAGPPEPESVSVPMDVEAGTFITDVILTDDGFEPDTVFLPAGRHIRLVIRNRGNHEHHYRIVGLIPTDLRWRQEPELDDYDLESSEEFADTYADDIEHVLHHLTPTYVPFKDESPGGIKPIGNEVHGYARGGGIDVVTFYALATGTYEVVDALYPELTGTVVVFDPRPSDS